MIYVRVDSLWTCFNGATPTRSRVYLGLISAASWDSRTRFSSFQLHRKPPRLLASLYASLGQHSHHGLFSLDPFREGAQCITPRTIYIFMFLYDHYTINNLTHKFYAETFAKLASSQVSFIIRDGVWSRKEEYIFTYIL